MTPAAEEAGEEVEGVVGLVGVAAGLLVLFEAFVAVLVVDAAGFGGGEGVVGFGYGDEFVVGGRVVSVEKGRMGELVMKLDFSAVVLRGRMDGDMGQMGDDEGDVRVLIWMVFLAEGSVCSFNVFFCS